MNDSVMHACFSYVLKPFALCDIIQWPQGALVALWSPHIGATDGFTVGSGRLREKNTAAAVRVAVSPVKSSVVFTLVAEPSWRNWARIVVKIHGNTINVTVSACLKRRY